MKKFNTRNGGEKNMTKNKTTYKVRIRENECSFECPECRREIIAEIKDNKINHICASCGKKTEVYFGRRFWKQELLDWNNPGEVKIALKIAGISLGGGKSNKECELRNTSDCHSRESGNPGFIRF